MSCLCQLLEGDLDGGRRVKGRRNHRQNQLRDFNFFYGKIKKRLVHQQQYQGRQPGLLQPCVKTALPQGDSVMLNSECAYLGASPFGGGTGKQESISSQPGCQFSPNCRNLIPLGTSVPLSALLKIDQQTQRSPGSIKHEHINLISFGNWKKKKNNKAFFAQFPIKTY